MGFLDTPMRITVLAVEDGDDEWIDVKRISAAEFRKLQEEAAKAEPEFDGDTKGMAESFQILKKVRERIVAWSDDADPTPENIERLPMEINTLLVQQIGVGASAGIPLPNGSTWSDSYLDDEE